MNDFTYQYAIRRPDGEFIRIPKSSDLFGSLFGRTCGTDETRPPRTWDSREAADSALNDIRERAADLGVGDWLGVVVQRLCTPFTLHDPAEHFAEEVQQWMDGGCR
ncbi:hypothetical protein [Mycolicibacterium llatzerense]|uniref:hypothetical protein n=1 Tax=Mycolicibacterium llatzerense TaxID=280871 RepID=UPI0021B4FD34|nr:hypothetical protein [Mycolicibacterium llatzerense]MCT7365624.1 hypothetical protein [Mycolicibacterium llatzerense]